MSLYDAVWGCDIEALQAADPADLIPFLPALVWQADWQPARRSILAGIPAQANLILHIHEIILCHKFTECKTFSSLEFARLPLDGRIRLIFDALRKQRFDPILSDSLFREEIGAVIAAAILHSIEIVPLAELIKTLFMQTNGADLVFLVAINCHAVFMSIIKITIQISLDEIEFRKPIRSLLARVASLSRSTAFLIRKLLLQYQTAPALVLQITLDNIRDEVEFVSAILTQRDLFASRFLSSLRSNTSSTAVSRGHRNTTTNSSLIQLLLDRFSERLQNSDAVSVSQITLIIRCLCQLQAVIQVIFPRELISIVLKVMPSPLSANSYFLDSCLCFLFQCPGLFKAVSKEHVTSVLRAFTSSPLFKLIAAGCLNGERSVGSSLSEIVGVPVRLVSGHVEKLSELIISETSLKDALFDTEFNSVANISLVLGTPAITKRISHDSVLRNGLRDRLSSLIATPGSSSAWITVLQRTAEFCLNCQQQSIQPLFSENHINSLILNAMKPECSNQNETIFLISYYVLYYNQAARKRTSLPFKYSDSVLDSVPLFAVMRDLQQAKSPFSMFHAQFQDLIFDGRREMFDPDIELQSLIPARLGLRKNHESPNLSTSHLEDLLSSPYSRQFLSWIPTLLDLNEEEHPYLFFCFAENWKHNSLGQMSLYLETLSYFSSPRVSALDLSRNPVTALAVHSKIWSSPSLLAIFLHMLRALCIRYDRATSDTDRLLCSKTLLIRLLEISCSVNNERARTMIFRFISDEFRSSPELLLQSLSDAVSLQNLPLLSTVINGLDDSEIHIAEMLSSESEQQQIFALHCLSLLDCSSTKKLCGSVMKKLANETADSVVARIDVLKRSLPVFIQFSRSHPALLPEIIRLLSVLRPSHGFENSELPLARDVDGTLVAILDCIKTLQTSQ